MAQFSGSYTAIVTPFTDDGGQVDYQRLAELIEWQIAAGTDGIVPAGSTGESATLSHQEHDELVARTAELVAGRRKVVAGAGSNSTAEARRLVKSAEKAGADGVLVITPYYNKPTPEGLYRHFLSVAEATTLPVMMYNIPGRTGVNMSPATVARIREACPRVVSIKEASGIVDQTSQILASCDIEVMAGDDSLALPLMAVGAAGVVSVASNVAPERVKALVDAATAGDYAEARRRHYALLPLMRNLFVETNPIPVKAALKLMGRGNGVLRPPLCPPTPENEAIVRQTLEQLAIGNEQ